MREQWKGMDGVLTWFGALVPSANGGSQRNFIRIEKASQWSFVLDVCVSVCENGKRKGIAMGWLATKIAGTQAAATAAAPHLG